MATFVSKYSNLKLTIKATRTILVENQLVVDYGKDIQFTNGSFQTNDKDEINFMRNHPQLKEQFYEVKDIKKHEKKDNLKGKDREMKVAAS